MEQPDFIAPPTLRVTAPKPKMTVYYGLLIIALVCMLIACLFLYLEVRRFGGFGAVPQRITALGTPSVYVFRHGGHRGHREVSFCKLQVPECEYKTSNFPSVSSVVTS
jgi:hypothetical protein